MRRLQWRALGSGVDYPYGVSESGNGVRACLFRGTSRAASRALVASGLDAMAASEDEVPEDLDDLDTLDALDVPG